MGEALPEKEVLQWHPAFYAGMQIELKDEKENLIFENEHQLSKKPMGIDVLIIKKEKALPVRKNIGRIFRMYNIVEYKSPTDYLSIDDFYKVYGYAYFYKEDTGNADEIPLEELTITLVSEGYPAKLFRHLRKRRGCRVEEIENGIYYVKDDFIPIQIIVTSRLSEKENLWLKNLTNHIGGTGSARRLIDEYEKHNRDELYRAVMEIIVQANEETFQEVKGMCNALRELMKDEIEMEVEKRVEEEMKRVEEEMKRRERETKKLEAARQEEMRLNRENGIKILIECCRELLLSWQQTADKVALKYTIPMGTAQEYMKKFW